VTNKNYQRGAQFERRIRTYLEELGWTVFRMAGSKTKADLIAFCPSNERGVLHRQRFDECAHFIQCKAKGAFGTKEREEFLELVYRCDVVGLFACAPKRKIEFYYAGDRKSADQPFILPGVANHATNCDYHADQNPSECTCRRTAA